MSKTSYKIKRNAKLPEGVKLAKTSKKLKMSKTETFPLTQMNVGDAFFADGYTAKELGGVLHTKRGTRKGTKFIARTVQNSKQFGTYVYRIK